jgi:hypothetical protein
MPLDVAIIFPIKSIISEFHVDNKIIKLLMESDFNDIISK